MAKRRYDLDDAKIARFIKEGRGTGHGSTYKPWLTIQDVPSMGRSTRVRGFTSGREHHLLSDLETGLFFLAEWSEIVTDIREQFPLDREVTRMLADEMGITHPRDSRTQTDLVMTTDFLIDMRTDAGSVMTARAVKPAENLGDKRTLEKLELERRYWQREGVSWHIVTDRDLPRKRIGNLQWLHEMRSLEHLSTPHPQYWTDRCEQCVAALRQARHGSIADFVVYLESAKGFAPGEPLTALRHLAANRRIVFDLDEPFTSRAPITSLHLTGASSTEQRRSA